MFGTSWNIQVLVMPLLLNPVSHAPRSAATMLNPHGIVHVRLKVPLLADSPTFEWTNS